jgi:hypothetical protein
MCVRWFWASILYGVGPFLSHVLNCAFVYSSYSVIQGNAIFDRADEWVSLEVITLMGDVVLDVRIWESFFPSWATKKSGMGDW